MKKVFVLLTVLSSLTIMGCQQKTAETTPEAPDVQVEVQAPTPTPAPDVNVKVEAAPTPAPDSNQGQ